MSDHQHKFDTEKLRNRKHRHDSLNVLINILHAAVFITNGASHKVHIGSVIPKATVHVKHLEIAFPQESQLTDAKFIGVKYFQVSNDSIRSHRHCR